MNIFIHWNLVYILQSAMLEWDSAFKNACQSPCRIWRLLKYSIPASFHVFGIVWLLSEVIRIANASSKILRYAIFGMPIFFQLPGVFFSSWLRNNNTLYFAVRDKSTPINLDARYVIHINSISSWGAFNSTNYDAANAIRYQRNTEITASEGYYRPIRVSLNPPTASDGNVGDIWI